jgi:hypothetical protein
VEETSKRCLGGGPTVHSGTRNGSSAPAHDISVRTDSCHQPDAGLQAADLENGDLSRAAAYEYLSIPEVPIICRIHGCPEFSTHDYIIYAGISHPAGTGPAGQLPEDREPDPAKQAADAVLVTPTERRQLVKAARGLGQAIKDLVAIVQPATLLKWRR